MGGLAGDALNWSAYSSAEYEKFFEDAAVSEGEERLQLLRQAEAVLMNDMPVIPLYYYVSRHLIRPEVKGYHDNLRDIHLSRYLKVD